MTVRSDVVTLVNVGSAETLPPATLTPPGVEPSPILTVLVSGSTIIAPRSGTSSVSYTHLTLPTITEV